MLGLKNWPPDFAQVVILSGRTMAIEAVATGQISSHNQALKIRFQSLGNLLPHYNY